MVFIAIGFAGLLLIASPDIDSIFRLHSEEMYSELFLLDSNHTTANYPSSIMEGRKYSVYVDVSNHMTSSVYYVLKVKLGNHTDQLPNVTNDTPSPLETLYEYKFFVSDNETWEAPLVFSPFNVSFIENRAVINNIIINDCEFKVNKYSEWSTKNTGFYFDLLIELWIFSPQFNRIQFNNRFTNLKLNLIQTG